MKIRALWAMVAAFALVLAACGPSTEAVAELGSAERPVQVLFVPSVDAQVIVSGGEVMKEFLEEATGLAFEVKVPTSYAATIEEMCAAPEDTMGFIPGFGYVLASQLCGVDVSFSAVRFGWGVYWSQILVRRDSDVETLADLDGLTWAVPDLGSTSGYLVPLVDLTEAGVEASEIVEAGDHGAAVLAVYNGEADFSTSFFSPPLKEGGWAPGDDPAVPADLVESCAPTEEGRLFCGDDYRVLDARSSTTTDAPDIVQQVKILAISSPIPNDTLSFGPDFPADIRALIEDALIAFAAECDDNEDCAWNQSIGHEDFYSWTTIAPAADSDFDDLRKVVEDGRHLTGRPVNRPI